LRAEDENSAIVDHANLLVEPTRESSPCPDPTSKAHTRQGKSRIATQISTARRAGEWKNLQEKKKKLEQAKQSQVIVAITTIPNRNADTDFSGSFDLLETPRLGDRKCLSREDYPGESCSFRGLSRREW
jgi:hypothetical protein